MPKFKIKSKSKTGGILLHMANSQKRVFVRLYITVTWQWVRRRLKSPASRLFAQPFVQAQIKQKNLSSASLAFVNELYRWPVNSPHKRPVTRKMFPFNDVIMKFADNVSIMAELQYHSLWKLDDVPASMMRSRHLFLTQNTQQIEERILHPRKWAVRKSHLRNSSSVVETPLAMGQCVNSFRYWDHVWQLAKKSSTVCWMRAFLIWNH